MANPRKSYCHALLCPGRRACRDCRNISSRATRTRHALLPHAQRRRANARSYANVYQRRGLLHPQPCEGCGSPTAQKHHDDYAKPLEVRWICRRCHLSLHGTRSRTGN